MQRSSINPAILQQYLESAPNAAAKGQAAFFTPPAFAVQLMEGLPRHRPLICDLNCGAGSLLKAAKVTKNSETGIQHSSTLLGCDIDPSALNSIIPADLTLLYPLLSEVAIQLPLYVLNPPWDLHWPRQRLAELDASEIPAVARAFSNHDGRTSKDTIDSTIATLCIALDLSSYYSEGFLIASNATLDRLMFDENAPHSALATHIWARLTFDGNPMTHRDHAHRPELKFKTAVIYFARSHTSGPQIQLHNQFLTRHHRLQHRYGAELSAYYNPQSDIDKWNAVSAEWDRRASLDTRHTTPYHLSLSATGAIRTHLSLFERVSTKLNKQEADRLFALNGKKPMQLVLQRNTRDELLRVAGLLPGNPNPGWKVDPALASAIHSAIAQYHACRAPLYALPETQRLAFLEEEDYIECKKDLPAHFLSGQRYRISSQTLTVTRSLIRPNLMGEPEQIEHTGQELALDIFDEHGNPQRFLDARLLGPKSNTKITAERGQLCPVTDCLDLSTLTTHFIIPEVPDVATCQPEKFQQNFNLLHQLEQLTSVAA